jgi:ABC-type transport system involved in cytochrome bd biosynthesis fused ATPase/permease subunit
MTWFETLIDGLDTRIGDGQRGMSGGEIQRLGIARVLLTAAGFVILDEPTEHLDTETAEAVWKTLHTACADRGLLVITHDERVAAHCDGLVRLA